MILDQLAEWRQVFRGPAWSKAFQALERLDADAPDGDEPLDGGDIILKVMGYQTRERKDGILEAHREFIDIQAVLGGEEAFEWHPAGTLRERTPYDAQKDAVFFEMPAGAPAGGVLRPGLFAVFFPRDGHSASLWTGGAARTVKKAVIKLRASLVSDPFTWQ